MRVLLTEVNTKRILLDIVADGDEWAQSKVMGFKNRQIQLPGLARTFLYTGWAESRGPHVILTEPVTLEEALVS